MAARIRQCITYIVSRSLAISQTSVWAWRIQHLMVARSDAVSPNAIKLINDGNKVRVDNNNNAPVGMGSILNAIEQMQAHFDARLDRIEGMLLQHSMRLSRIENMKNG